MKGTILDIIRGALGVDLPVEITVPEAESFGHFSTNFALRAAKNKKMAPLAFAEECAAAIKGKAPSGFFADVRAAAPGFINFWVSAGALQKEFSRVADDDHYGKGNEGNGKTVIVEYSQPNIAKMMHVGHMRTTIIGAALANIFEARGYRVVRWNYLGDWGTQFGKLIAAYKMWGSKEAVEKAPIEELQKLYVRFHEEMKSDEALEPRGREEFRKLEEGDKENRKLWEWFKEESLKEFNEMYRALGVDFDVWLGESFFESEMKSTVKELLDKGLAQRSEGSIIVPLDAAGLPPALIEKSDGASLYLTRDIANLRYRIDTYHPAKILYVVGNEQSLHFEQLFAIAKMMGLDSSELAHIKYGLVLGEGGKKLSTRAGTAQLLKEVIDVAVEKARAVIEEKNADASTEEKREIADAVALAALKYNDLKENRMTDIIFDWEKMLGFTGDSAPYLLYTYARLKSVLRKSEESRESVHKGLDWNELRGPAELSLMRRIFELPDIVARAAELYSTSTIATYLYRLAVDANKFYETVPILKDENAPRRAARLILSAVAARTLKMGLELLGIKTLEKI